MAFDRPAGDYDRYMGRYSRVLAPMFAGFAGVGPGMRALDVGCGPGALTAVLALTVGASSVAAGDPSPTFVEACAARVPGADVRQARAEDLPWDDGSFDAVLAQLVVHFLADAPAGAAEMARVARPGGTVATCTWDTAGAMGLLETFRGAVAALDPPAAGRIVPTAYSTPEELQSLWEGAGLREVDTAPLNVEVVYDGFDEFWLPFTLGVGPSGAYCASLDPAGREALRRECARRLGDPAGGFTLTARAWAVRGQR